MTLDLNSRRSLLLPVQHISVQADGQREDQATGKASTQMCPWPGSPYSTQADCFSVVLVGVSHFNPTLHPDMLSRLLLQQLGCAQSAWYMRCVLLLVFDIAHACTAPSYVAICSYMLIHLLQVEWWL